MVYWACTKIYLKSLKRSWNIGNREYSLQYINDSNELRLEWERRVICKEREYWEKTEGFFITDGFMRFFISHRELVSPRTQHIRGSEMFRSIYKSKEALSSSPETWGVDNPFWKKKVFVDIICLGIITKEKWGNSSK